MYIYFVRHGESALNQDKKYQFEKTPLSTVGKSQAEKLAWQLTGIKFDLMMASPLFRAMQTAEILNKVHNCRIVKNNLLHEIRRPSIISGKAKDDPEAIAILKEVHDKYADPSWRHSDEETAYEIIERAHHVLADLTSIDAENVLVVTHRLFISVMVASMLFEEDISPVTLLRWLKFSDMDNAAVTLCQYTGKQQWKLISWNAQGERWLVP